MLWKRRGLLSAAPAACGGGSSSGGGGSSGGGASTMTTTATFTIGAKFASARLRPGSRASRVDRGKTGDVFRIAWNGGPSHGGVVPKGGITVT